MIPLQLQLKNFLSYGAEFQTIDFSSYHLICLSGKNGHGKSAILDAMTWALWGQARKSAGAVRADQSLLRLGTNKMVVIFDFEFNNRAYRVKREFYVTSSKKSQCLLEFGMFDTDGKTIIPLTDKTIRQTQKKIEQTIGLDFDTFINSAFLRQGNANEFSKKSSRDRKDILGKILSLEQYELLRRKASDKVKAAQMQKEVLSRLQEKRLARQEQLTSIKKDHTQLLADIKVLLADQKAHKTNVECTQKAVTALQEKEHTYATLCAEEKKLQVRQEELWHTVRTTRTKYKQARALTVSGQKETLEKKRTQLQKNISEQQTVLQKKLTLEKALLDINAKREIIKQAHTLSHSQAIQKATLESERIQAEMKQLATQKKNLLDTTATITKELDVLARKQKKQTAATKEQNTTAKQIETITAQFEKRKSAYQQYATIGNMVREQLQEINQKQTLCKDENNPTCPLCEQNLSASRRRFLKDKFDTQYKKLYVKFNRLKKVIPSLRLVMTKQHKALQALQEVHKEGAVVSVQLQELEKSIAKYTKEQIETEKEIKILDTQLQTIEKQYKEQEKALKSIEKNATAFQQDKMYIQLTTEYESTQKEFAACAYDEKKYTQVQTALAEIEKQLSAIVSIKDEENKQSERKHSITTALQQLRMIKTSCKELHTKLDAYKNIAKEKANLTAQVAEQNKTATELEKRKEVLLEKKGQLQTAQTHLDELQKEYTEEQKRISELEKTIQDYAIIATAASKEGIQALLIEQAIPEIEHEANRLLSKLTHNTTQIIIESLRDLKRGGTKETLDINISDPAGIRPYELFSGGEAFRIDLALRVAISKLLARRAGTALQTLIIDEGFGSQDEDGLQNIMDAIYKIQDDFSKVIIVSHLPAMKDGFPIHFCVEKHPRGSTVTVLQQG